MWRNDKSGGEFGSFFTENDRVGYYTSARSKNSKGDNLKNHLVNKDDLRGSASKLNGYSYRLAFDDFSLFTIYSAQSAYIPSDTGYSTQWHLKNTATGIDINVEDVWNDYTGDGIKVAILDDGVEYTHEDLIANYDAALDLDVSPTDVNDLDAMAESGDRHGTAVAGIIAAANNGVGGVGVAFDSTIAGIRLDFDYLTVQDLVNGFNHAANFDVMNNSWSINSFYYDNLYSGLFAPIGDALQNTAATGRNGLGTSMVFSAGNSKLDGHNVNNHGFQNSRYTVTVGAIGDDGTPSFYSTPGASVLVSAPSNGGSQGIYTTDRTGSEGYSTDDYTSAFGGTSAAAPIVSGIIALMYEANPLLGYRDVQEILALSARQTDATNPEWTENGATNWNGGGMHVSHDVGYGLVDAYTAVRLAESWTTQNTAHNEESVSISHLSQTLAAGTTTSITSSVGMHLDIDHVEVSMVMNASSYFLSTLTISLTSPDGTTSILAHNGNSSLSDLDWNFTSTRHWGEDSFGEWTVTFTNDGPSSIELLNLDLNFFGDSTKDDTYVYTEEFSDFANAERTILDDTDGGNDTINTAAVRSNSVIDLDAGTTSTIDGQSVLLSAGSLIENAYSGDGNDQLSGNALNNTLSGGRGDDLLIGGAGDDILIGGSGSDTAYFAGNYLDYTLSNNGDGTYQINGLDGFDTISGIEWLQFDDGTFDINNFLNTPNSAPIAVTESISAEENNIITGYLEASDVDGDTLSYALIEAPTKGTLMINADGSYSFAPQGQFETLGEGQTENLTFTYSVSDGTETVTQAATITITGNNDAPIINLLTEGTDIGVANTTEINTGTFHFGNNIAELVNGNIIAISETSGAGYQKIVYSIISDTGEVITPDTFIYQPTAAIINPEVISFADGSWMVSWFDTSHSGFVAQTYEADGSIRTPLFTLSSYPVQTYNVNSFNLEHLSDGRFALTWTDLINNTANIQVFDQTGNALTNNLVLSAHASSSQQDIALTELDNGDLLIGGAWTSPTNPYKAYAGTYVASTDLTSVSELSLWNANETQNGMAFEKLANGNIVASWKDNFQNYFNLQVLDGNGTPIGEIYQVPFTGSIAYPVFDIVGHPDSGFTLWFQDITSNVDLKLMAQRFDASGSPQGQLQQIDPEHQIEDVLILQNGTFVTSEKHSERTLTFTEGYWQKTSLLDLSDIDSSNLISATIEVSSGYVEGQDILKVTIAQGSSITSTFDSVTGKIELTGLGSFEEYQAVLRSLTILSSSVVDKTVTVHVNDGSVLNSSSNIVSYTVTSILRDNEAPIIETSEISGAEDYAVTGVLLASDVNGDTLSYSLIDAPAKGALTINPDGSYSFDPKGAFEYLGEGDIEDLTFTFSVSDGIETITHTANISVTGTNDAPVISLVTSASSGSVIHNFTQRFSWQTEAVTLDDGRIFIIDSDLSAITVNCFDANGNSIATPLVLNEPVNGYATRPAITTLADGTVMAVWREDVEKTGNSVGYNSTMKGQRLSENGDLIGGIVRFDGADASDMTAVIGLDNGQLVMFSGDYGRIYGIDGTVQSDPMYPGGLNSYGSPLHNIDEQIIKKTPDGGFVLAYYNYYSDGGLFVQRYGANGQAIEAPVRIAETQQSPDAVTPDMYIGSTGDIWLSWGGAYGEGPINVSHFDSETGRWDETISPVYFTGSSQVHSQIVGLADGSFVLAWNERMVQHFASDGTPLSEAYQYYGSSSEIPYSLEHIAGDQFALVAGTSIQTLVIPTPDAIPISLSDMDGDTLSSATVTITEGHISGFDEISIILPPNSPIEASFDPATGHLTLSGTASIADYEAALKTITVSGPVQGPRTLSIQVSDGSNVNALSNTVSFIYQNVIYTGVVAETSEISAQEDSSISGVLQASSGISESLTFNLIESPSKGLLNINPDGSYSFNPQGAFEYLGEGATESLSFTYSVSDGRDTISRTATITVTGANDAPEVIANDIAANENISVIGNLIASDIDGDALIFTLIEGPAKGLLSVSPDGSYSFDPQGAFDYLGEGATESLSFTYSVSDGKDTISHTATITVTGTNDAPIVLVDDIAANEDNFVTGMLLTNDVDGDTLTFTLIEGPVKGLLSINPDGSYSFDPQGAFEYLGEGATENLTFIYSVSDGRDTVNHTATITVTGANDAPEVMLNDVVTSEDDSVSGMLLANDADGDALTFTLIEGPARGSLLVTSNGFYHFDPQEEFETLKSGETEELSFTYSVSDGTETVVQTATITVTGRNDASLISVTNNPNTEITAGSEVQVNTNTRGSQSHPDVTTLSDGTIVTTWQGDSNSSIYVRHFDSNGNAITSEIKTRPDVGKTSVLDPRITALPDGGYVVSWIDGNYVSSQQFSASGAKVDHFYHATSTLPVVDYDVMPNAYSSIGISMFITDGTRWSGDTGTFTSVDAAYLTNGNSVTLVNQIVNGNYTLKLHVDGIAVTETPPAQSSEIASEIVVLQNGGFALTWASNTGGVFANIYSAEGTLISANISISSTTISAGTDLQTIVLNDGTFVVAWQDANGFKAQVIDSSGNLIGGEMIINNGETTGTDLAIAATSDGGFSAVWQENGEISMQSFKASSTTPSYSAGDAPLILFDNVSIEDIDSGTLNSAKIVISTGFVVGEDILNVTLDPAGALTASFDATNGVLTINGEASLIDYQAILESVTYENTSTTPSGTARSFTLQTNDGSPENTLSNEVTVGIEIGTSDSGGNDPAPEPTPEPTPDPAPDGIINGTTASETLDGTANDDAINGFEGDDILNGGDGNDTLSGGTGADILSGGTGNDTYLFNRGDEGDTINNKGEAGSNDRVLFGTDISYDQLWFTKNRNDLQVSVIGTDDSVTFKGWYSRKSPNMVASFETSEGATLNSVKVDSLVSAMAAFNPPTFGEIDLSGNLQDNLMTTIYAAWENESV